MGTSNSTKPILEPVTSLLMSSLNPRTVVEIGCGDGQNTRELLRYTKEKQVTLHVIDKQPGFAFEELAENHKENLVFHRSLALNALGKIESMDLVIMDGDPNWYTVLQELKLIGKGSDKNGHPFPCVLVNHVGWPYGRRDAYRDPEVIPEAYRQPSKQLGLVPGESGLSETKGIFPKTFHAIYENELRNGVLTAVEDFLKEQDRPLEWIAIPAQFGLGLLFPKELKKSNNEFASVVKSLSMPPVVSTLMERLESARITAEVELAAVNIEIEQQVAQAKQSQEKARKDLETLQNNYKKNQQSLDSIKDKLAEYQSNLEEKSKKLSELSGRAKGEREKYESELHSLHLQVDELKALAGKKDDQLADWGNQLKELKSRADQATQKYKEQTAQLNGLKARYQNLMADVQKLAGWLDTLSAKISTHLNSWTWKIGSLVLAPVKIALRRERKPARSLQVFKIIDLYSRWKSGHLPR